MSTATIADRETTWAWTGEAQDEAGSTVRGVRRSDGLEDDESIGRDDDDRAGLDFGGRFHVRRMIGRGGMGTVLEVERRSDGEVLALKYCHLGGAERKRFEREVRIMERVRHPHVVPIVEARLDHRVPYFLMPLAEGSLMGQLEMFQENENEALAAFAQICAGVQALHASGIIHRDIKPANVLRFAGGRIAVADFGLAKLGNRDSTILTRTHAFYGTLVYSAPEQHLPAGTREADVRTDICQLGKMLYHMLTGKSPALIEQEALPRGLAHVIQRATSAHPEDRYQTLGELLDALRYYELSRHPARDARATLENLIQQAEGLLKRQEYRSENLREILATLQHVDLKRDGPGMVIACFDRLPTEVLPVLAGELPADLALPLRTYAEAIEARVASYPFAYADTVARRMRSIFVHGRTTDLKTTALRINLVAAVALNRFAAMDAFNRLLVSIHDDDLAMAVAELLRREIRLYEKVAEQVPPGRLHPAIRGVQVEGLGS